jgi:DNA-binding NarL/FixJ family response regulator
MNSTFERRSVLVVDDHTIVRQGLALLIEQEPDLRVTGSAADLAQALDLLRKTQFDLALVDISLSGRSGLELVRRIVDGYPATRVVVLTMHEESLYWERAMAAGAHGFVMKSDAPAYLVKAMRTVLLGAMYYSEKVQVLLADRARDMRRTAPATPLALLGDKELDVLRLIGRGLGTGQIAAQLNRSVKTIETHKANLRSKLGLQNAAELTAFATRWLIDGDDHSRRADSPPDTA